MTLIKDDTSQGAVSYNGYAFPPLRSVTLKGHPEWDEAERVVVGIKYTITVHFIIQSAAEATQGSAMASCRSLLLAPAGALNISGIGYGTIAVNTVTPDLRWGPKPLGLEMKPIAGMLAWDVVWACEFFVPQCGGGTYDETMLMAVNVQTVYDVDLYGITKRTMSGYLQIPQTRGATPIVQRTADSYWSRMSFPIPPGFMRVSQQRRVSLDNNRLDFVLVDEEMSNFAPPPGVVYGGDVDYTFETANIGFSQFNATLAGEFETIPTVPTSRAAYAFLTILTQKLTEIKNLLGGQGFVLVRHLRMSRSLFSRRNSFDVSFTVTGTIRDFLGAMGMWSPVPNSNYQQWMAALPGGAGIAGLSQSGGQQVLVDVCQAKNAFVMYDAGGSYQQQSSEIPTLAYQSPVSREQSYLHYENSIGATREESMSPHKFSQPYTPDSDTSSYQGSESSTTWGPNFTGRDDTLQYQGTPSDTLVMRGRAVRAQFEPDIPAVRSVGGVPYYQMGRHVMTKPVAKVLGDITLFASQWEITYRAAGSASSLASQANPTLGMN